MLSSAKRFFLLNLLIQHRLVFNKLHLIVFKRFRLSLRAAHEYMRRFFSWAPLNAGRFFQVYIVWLRVVVIIIKGKV